MRRTGLLDGMAPFRVCRGRSEGEASLDFHGSWVDRLNRDFSVMKYVLVSPT